MSRIARALAVALMLVLMPGAAPIAATAQVRVDENPFRLEARQCPDGYTDVDYAVDCAEPLPDYRFDVAGPINDDVTTDEEGVAALGAAEPGTFTIEAFDVEADANFAVECARDLDGIALPVAIDYGDAGFDVDLEAEFARDVPDGLTLDPTVTCIWYAIPGVPAAEPEERPGIVWLLGRACPDRDSAELVAQSPGAELNGLESVGDCDSARVAATLSNDETGDETDIGTDGAADAAAIAVEPGTYTAEAADAESTDSFTVRRGEVTLLVVLTPRLELEATLRTDPTPTPPPPPQPTQTPEPSPDPVPLAAIEFGSGEWQGGFPNINTGIYDRSAVAVYGAQSEFPAASLRFELPGAPSGGATLTIEGLADELGPAEIAIAVNGAEVYRGPSGFASWNPSAPAPAWTAVAFVIPPGVLQSGPNEITVANLAQSSAVFVPPYILLSTATLSFDG